MSLLETIRDENLNVYRASSQRLQEDVGQEGEIAQNYRGRLIYELMQNADDAMGCDSSSTQTIRLVLTDTELWVANSGRPLNEADVRGLCGISASSKSVLTSKRRASIGHKGMGFKSVLEITDAPEVYSTTFSFRFSQDDAVRAVQPLVDEGHISALIKRAPITRFPWAISEEAMEWHAFREIGMNTVFRFPLRSGMSEQQRRGLSQALKSLPITSLIFLKSLDRIEVDIQRSKDKHFAAWTVKRQQISDAGNIDVGGLSDSGGYQVTLASDLGDSEIFIVSHDADIIIGEHRGGLNEFTWEGIEYTEVSLAVRMQAGHPSPLSSEWKKLHVFLPTGEPSPYNILVNGAFSSSLSRQEIRVEPDATNYNRHLLHEAARILRDRLIPLLESSGVSVIDCLSLLDRGVSAGSLCSTPAAQALYEEVTAAIIDSPLILSEQGDALAIGACAVPPLVPDQDVGGEFRLLMPSSTIINGRPMPRAEFCRAIVARILVDHGAHCLSPHEVALLLAEADPARSMLFEHESGKMLVDPVLRVLERLWRGLSSDMQQQLASEVRSQNLFPVAVSADGSVRRISTHELTCFYPPRFLHGEVPLSGLCFLLQDVCWGKSNPKDRNDQLRQPMDAWKTLFDIREFKFPEVMRASVLPALDLDRKNEIDAAVEHNDRLQQLAAICQLAGRTPNPKAPLPYERLGSNRALFNLSRLEVPCRGESEGDIVWVPAYKAYFGIDWVGEKSVEQLIGACEKIEGASLPRIDFMIAPNRFDKLLDMYRHLDRSGEDESGAIDEEVSLEEDDESAIDSDDLSRWMHFFTWLGVNQSMRPVHFHDVEDRASGWTGTNDLKRPNGRAFRDLPSSVWDRYVQQVKQLLHETDEERLNQSVPYFYRIHSLEHLHFFLDAAAQDASACIGRALYEHLALNWGSLERFSQTNVALIPKEQRPTLRNKPPSAKENEIVEIGPDFWMFQLRNASFCPTGHGPRAASKVWWPTPEVKRRFERRSRPGSYLIPVVDAAPLALKGKAKGFAQAIGIRDELSAATFTLDDVRSLLERMAELFKDRCDAQEDLRTELRAEIRPGYRHLFELLSGHDAEADDKVADAETGIAPLYNELLLSQNATGQLAFVPANQVFYVDRRDTKDKLWLGSSVWMFVIEAYPTARVPLIRLFGVRELESSLSWSPRPGEAALEESGCKKLQEELYQIAPYLLARLGTDRETDRLMQEDARRMRMLIDKIEPVQYLGLSCALDGQDCHVSSVDRDAFVLLQKDSPDQAFVIWGEHPWPPDPREAEALVTALCDVFGSRYFESFLALVSAPTTDARIRILRRAGAPLDIDEKRALLVSENNEDAPEAPSSVLEVEEPKTASAPESLDLIPNPTPEITSPGGSERIRTSLYRAEDLLVEGLPVTVFGKHDDNKALGDGVERSGIHAPHSSGRNGDGGYGGHTDLNALDELGMWIAMSFERKRLRQSGVCRAEILDLSNADEQPEATVFDVTTPDKIARGCELSKLLDQALSYLHREYGISREWPGFDVLAIDPRANDLIDRLIELKSSGVASRVQEMSWNEWKIARSSSLSQRFYLYLVGNLRSDIPGSEPFIRTIRNPFDQLRSDVRESRAAQHRVQLSVYDFEQADELKLSVVRTHRLAETSTDNRELENELATKRRTKSRS